MPTPCSRFVSRRLRPAIAVIACCGLGVGVALDQRLPLIAGLAQARIQRHAAE